MSSFPEDLVQQCRVASPHDAVHNSECVYTFHSPFTTSQGLLVNLTTFVGTRETLSLQKEGERGLFVRIVKKRVAKEPKQDSTTTMSNTEQQQKPTKLGIGIEGGFAAEDDKFEILSDYSIVLLEYNNGKVQVVTEVPYTDSNKSSLPQALVESVDSILHHAGMAVQQDLSVWQLDDEPKPVSKYCENLPFVDNGVVISPNPKDWKCQKSGAMENLWLNLSDGYIGGGRQHWDGSGGSNGALDHYVTTGEQYPLVVKLGTITADLDTADCYSYAKDEDGPVKIPNLAELLEKRGIHVGAMKKTVKSTAELEVELNATYAFDAITEAGAHLVPVSGPGLQGLQNLGNSCYMNSVAQLLLSGTVPEFQARYAGKEALIAPSITPKEAPDHVVCQTCKLASALTSGEFAGPAPQSATVTDDAALDPKYRLQPRMFKHAIARNHAEFRTGQQQDAAHFFQYLLEQLDRAEQHVSSKALLQQAQEGKDTLLYPASHLFQFGTTLRLVCQQDQRVKYKDSAPETLWSVPIPMDKAVVVEQEPELKRPKTGDTKSESDQKPVPTVTFHACMEAWAAETTIEDIRWPHFQNQKYPAKQQTRFRNFPRYLLVQMQRYQLGPDWTPQKLEVKLDIAEEIDISSLKFSGPQPGENLVPREEEETSGSTSQAAPAATTIDEGALAQLMDMGFHINGCKRALMAVGGSNVEAAMNWVFEHNADPDFNDPLPENNDSAAAPAPADSDVDEGVAMSLVENLGCFTMDQVRAALKETNGAADRAADWLFSHMDDLDGAIASLNSAQPSSTSSAAAASVPLDDGEGRYCMTGMISHIGKHTGSGHYVAHLKRGDKWVIFNDEKVALSESPPFAHAYMYLFQRKDTIGSSHQSY